jgi:hypothetical protein
MRKLNDMFHIEGEQLVKTSNGEPVPEDEPVFILRGRDMLAINAIVSYKWACEDCGVPTDRIAALREVEDRFREYRSRNKTKLPGVTHGA